MYRLLLKDMRVSLQFLVMLLIMIPFITGIAIWAMVDDFGGVIIVIIALITIVACLFSASVPIIVDSSSKAETIFASLPIERLSIVNSRYVSSVLWLCFGFGLILLTIVFFNWGLGIIDPAFEIILSTGGIISMLTLLIFLLAFLLPFIFRYGSGKGAVRAFFVQIVFIILVTVLEVLRTKFKEYFEINFGWITQLLESFQSRLLSLSAHEIFLILIAMALVTMLISIFLSRRFYLNLDL